VIVVLVLNLGVVAGLVTVGLTAHSLAVLAEGGRLSPGRRGRRRLAGHPPVRAPTSPAHPNATGIAALVNCGWLLALEVFVAGAAGRLATRTPKVDGLPVLVMSGVAALTMTAGALVLRTDADEDEADGGDPSVAAVLLDTVADAAAAAGVAATGAIILRAAQVIPPMTGSASAGGRHTWPAG
jgi:cobalt-zinc-cadmium efflux system protein